MDSCSFHVWQLVGCRDKMQLAVPHLVTEECRGLILFSNQILGRLFLCCDDVTMLKINVKPLESLCFSFLNRATFVRKIRDCDWLMSSRKVSAMVFPPVVTRHAAPTPSHSLSAGVSLGSVRQSRAFTLEASDWLLQSRMID